MPSHTKAERAKRKGARIGRAVRKARVGARLIKKPKKTNA